MSSLPRGRLFLLRVWPSTSFPPQYSITRPQSAAVLIMRDDFLQTLSLLDSFPHFRVVVSPETPSLTQFFGSIGLSTNSLPGPRPGLPTLRGRVTIEPSPFPRVANGIHFLNNFFFLLASRVISFLITMMALVALCFRSRLILLFFRTTHLSLLLLLKIALALS